MIFSTKTRAAECFHSLDHRSGNQIAPFGRIHLQLFITIDDRARLEQDRGHFGFFEHDKLVVSVNPEIGVHQFMLVLPHECPCILPSILQTPSLQLLPEQRREKQARIVVLVVTGNEKRIAANAIAEVAWRTLKLPILKQPIRHGIVVDRKKQICRKLVSGGHPLEQAWSCPTVGHQQHGAGEPIRYQALLDLLT